MMMDMERAAIEMVLRGRGEAARTVRDGFSFSCSFNSPRWLVLQPDQFTNNTSQVFLSVGCVADESQSKKSIKVGVCRKAIGITTESPTVEQIRTFLLSLVISPSPGH